MENAHRGLVSYEILRTQCYKNNEIQTIEKTNKQKTIDYP